MQWCNYILCRMFGITLSLSDDKYIDNQNLMTKKKSSKPPSSNLALGENDMPIKVHTII